MRRPKSSFSTSKKSAGKTPSKTDEGVKYTPLTSPEPVWLQTWQLAGTICKTLYYDNDLKKYQEVAVLSYREDCPSQTGVLVKVQKWDGSKMVGKTAELDLAWLLPTAHKWTDTEAPFDDDIPF